MTLTRTQWILLAVVTITILAALFLTQTGIVKPSCIGAKSVNTQYGLITICTSLPPTPENVTLYRVVPQDHDFAYFSVDNLEQGRPNCTTVDEVPSVVPKTLEKYGGLPGDAELVFAETEYLEQFQYSEIPFFPSEVIAKYPISTDVQYGRRINSIPVVGPGGKMMVILGNYGELLYLNKIWRTVEPAGTAKIIPASEAIEKMGRGEILGDRPKLISDLNINKIRLLYYEKDRGQSQEYLEPVWGFSGTLNTGDPWKYYVPAREGSTLETPGALSTPRTGLAYDAQL